MRDYTNLLEETIAVLKSNYKAPEHVRWVGSEDGQYSMSWEQFAALAKPLNYDAGFGGQVIASDLVIVGDGWWLERSEYDGSESWAFKQQPLLAANPKPIARLTDPEDASWVTVAESNTGGKFA